MDAVWFEPKSFPFMVDGVLRFLSWYHEGIWLPCYHLQCAGAWILVCVSCFTCCVFRLELFESDQSISCYVSPLLTTLDCQPLNCSRINSLCSLFPTDSVEREVQVGATLHLLVVTPFPSTPVEYHFPAVDGILSSQLAVGILSYRLS